MLQVAHSHPIQRGRVRTNRLGRLTCLAREGRTAIMCAEAVWWRCHRGVISDYSKVRGWRVLHILEPQKVQEHPFTSAARILAGALCYR